MFASIILSLFAVFSQTTTNEYEEHTIAGKMLVHDTRDSVFLQIQEPLKQNIAYSASNMLIYYPDDLRAFDIRIPQGSFQQVLGLIPTMQSYDREQVLTMGLHLTSEYDEGDTLISQFINMNEDHYFPVVHLWSVDSITVRMTIATDVGQYQRYEIQEMMSLGTQHFPRKYSVSSYRGGQLLEKVQTSFDEVRDGSADDLEQFRVVIPEDVEIEERSLME